MKRATFLLILFISIEVIFSQLECDFLSDEIIDEECKNGLVIANKDDIGNKPDSCCKVYIHETFCDSSYGCSSDFDHYCMQIKKDNAKDYINTILDKTNLEADYIKITCDGELTYEIDFKSLSSCLIKSFNLSLLFLLFLF